MTWDVLPRLARTAKLYRAHLLDPSSDKYADAQSDPWQSLAFFVEHYAFERQGRAPGYAPAARRAMQQLAQDRADLSAKSARLAWKLFSSELGGQKLNQKVSPMAPAGTHYREDANSFKTKKPSVIEAAPKFPPTIHACSLNLMRNGETRRAHEQLEGINGIGPKIASFFLRDVALANALMVEEDRYLLQPIDVWIRRTAEFCTDEAKASDRRIAEAIVQECSHRRLNPEHVNAGAWYFGANIARSEREFDRALKDRLSFDALIKDYATRMRALADAISEIVD